MGEREREAGALEQLAYTRGTAASACAVPGKVIDAAITRGELAAIKSGRRLVILKADLIAWLELCKKRGFFPSSATEADKERLAALGARAKTSRQP